MITKNKRTPYELSKIKNDYKNLGISLSSTFTPLVTMKTLITVDTPDQFNSCFDSKSIFMMVLESEDFYPNHLQVVSGNHFFESQLNKEHACEWIKRTYKKNYRKSFSARLAHVYVTEHNMTYKGVIFMPLEKHKNNMIKILN